MLKFAARKSYCFTLIVFVLKRQETIKNNNTKQYLLFSNSYPVLKLDISYLSLSLIFLAHCCVLISLVSVKPLKNLCQQTSDSKASHSALS